MSAGQGTQSPSLAEATRVWARIGVLGFGGPAGQIALMHRIVVDEKKWISEPRFLHALNFCMLLPGPEAQQLATYLGWLMHGTRGGVIAGTLFVLPGLAVLLALSAMYAVFHQTDWLATLFFGLKAAVIAIVIEALVRIGRRALRGSASLLLAAAAFVALFAFHAPFPIVILAAGAIGFAAPPSTYARAAVAGEDTDEIRETAPPALARTAARILAWLAIWALPVALVGAVFGWGSTFATLGAFFSLMAVVTFGGAYAVLAWVADVAVTQYHWLQPGEMLDGLALAETTPGPLVLVLTFVAFLAGFRDAGELAPLAGGLLGALLVAWVTFVPSFLWIFAGAPYVERLRGNRRLSAALGAITAAVVGVILNLAVFLALHVLFDTVADVAWGPIRLPLPAPASLNWAALVILLVAAAALFRFKLGIAWTLLLCCLLGVAARAMGL